MMGGGDARETVIEVSCRRPPNERVGSHSEETPRGALMGVASPHLRGLAGDGALPDGAATASRAPVAARHARDENRSAWALNRSIKTPNAIGAPDCRIRAGAPMRPSR